MEFKLILAAEDFANCYGIVIFEGEDYYIEIDQSIIPSDFLNRLKGWYKEYYPYTGMIPKELKPHKENIEKLDRVGISLLKEINSQNIFSHLNINKYVYYSRGIDKALIELKK